jgi:hypothetical protein
LQHSRVEFGRSLCASRRRHRTGTGIPPRKTLPHLAAEIGNVLLRNLNLEVRPEILRVPKGRSRLRFYVQRAGELENLFLLVRRECANFLECLASITFPVVRLATIISPDPAGALTHHFCYPRVAVAS